MADHDAFAELAMRYFDGLCDGDDFARLNAALIDDAELRRLFNRMAIQTRILREIKRVPGEDSTRTLSYGNTDADAAKATRRRTVRIAALAIAAAVAMAATLAIVFMQPGAHHAARQPAASVANLTDMHEAVFADHAEAPALGTSLAAGPIRLVSGKAQVMFNSTAVVDLSGPCDFNMTGPNAGELRSGRLEAYVPTAAHGFSIRLPGGASVVDLGTRFTLAVDRDAAMVRLAVIEGSVQVHDAAGAGKGEAITRGQVVLIGEGGASLAFAVPLVNASFEQPVVEADQFAGEVPGWDVPTGWAYVTHRPRARRFDPAKLPDGSQVANLPPRDTPGLVQQVGEAAAGRYTLRFYAGAAADYPTRGLTAELLVDDQPIGSRTLEAGQLSPGAWRVFEVGGRAASAGRLSIRFRGLTRDAHDKAAAWVDHVELFKSVESPGSTSPHPDRKPIQPGDAP